MFRATHHPLSGAQKLLLQPLVLHTFLVAGSCDGSATAAAGNKKVCKTEAAITVFELLMMGGVSHETR
jgi:hypothetical protein